MLLLVLWGPDYGMIRTASRIEQRFPNSKTAFPIAPHSYRKSLFDLEPKGDEARRIHDSMITSPLFLGTTVSVLVRSPLPSPQHYLIERIFPGRPRVRDQSGELLKDDVTAAAQEATQSTEREHHVDHTP